MLGYIIGNGWEDTTVAYTDEKYPDMEPYKGTYLTASKDASAFESLLAKTGDRMLHYESTRYDVRLKVLNMPDKYSVFRQE